MKTKHTCTVLDCDLKHHAKGYCRKHYRRFKRRGTADRLRPPTCTVSSCDAPHYAKALCARCYQRRRKRSLAAKNRL